MTEQHDITLVPHPDVKTIHTAHCACGDGMKHPGTSGIIQAWIDEHEKKIRDASLDHLPRTW